MQNRWEYDKAWWIKIYISGARIKKATNSAVVDLFSVASSPFVTSSIIVSFIFIKIIASSSRSSSSEKKKSIFWLVCPVRLRYFVDAISFSRKIQCLCNNKRVKGGEREREREGANEEQHKHCTKSFSIRLVNNFHNYSPDDAKPNGQRKKRLAKIEHR